MNKLSKYINIILERVKQYKIYVSQRSQSWMKIYSKYS